MRHGPTISDELEALTRELGLRLAVGPGSTVTVRDLADDQRHEYTIAADAAVELKPGRVSVQSPIASALMGTRTLGEEMTVRLPSGERRFEVSRIHVRGSTEARQLAAWSSAETESSPPLPTSAGVGDPPWVFVADSERVLRQVQLGEGQARVALQQPWALVAARSEMEVEVEVEALDRDCFAVVDTLDGDCSAVVDTLRQGPCRLYRVAGTVGFRAEDGSLTVVETGPASDRADFEYRLHGKRRLFGRAATPLFLGRPAMQEWRDGALQGEVAEEDMEWLPAVPGATWQPAHPTDAVLGLGLLRLARAGVVRRSVQLCVLPAGADTKIRPVADARRGEIVLTGFGEIEAAVEEQSGVEAKGQSGDSGWGYRLELIARDNPPPRAVVVAVQWRGREGPLGAAKLKLPFPAEDAAFFGARGEELPPGVAITPAQMAGVRAEIIVRGGTDFKLVGRYVGKDDGEIAGRCGMIAADVPAAGPGRHVLDLAALKPDVADALAASRDVDGAVELRVHDPRQADAVHPAFVIVQCFNLRLEPRRAGSHVLKLDAASRSNMSARDVASLVVEARDLLDPNLKPTTLQRTGDHGWRAPRRRLAPGPYLVVGRQDGHHRVWPLVWHYGSVPPHADGAAGRRPRNVAEAYSRRLDEAEAVEAFRSVAGRMGEQPDSSDWRLAFAYLRETALPVRIFPLLQALAETPKACAMAAVVADTPEEFDLLWERMQTLSFAWRQVPLRCWREAFAADAKHRREAVSEFDDTDLGRLLWQYRDDAVGLRINQLKSRLSGMDEEFDLLHAELTGESR